LPNTRKAYKGILWVVSTPIGNLKDISLRALEILNNVDYIACEDTRVTIRLLNRYNIKKPLISFHSKSKDKVLQRIAGLVLKGSNIAYMSDSGTPVISDPGSKLIRQIIDGGGEAIPIPGPSAVHAALAASGLSFSEYTFAGFLSNKGSRRRKKLGELKDKEGVFVFFESPYRIIDFLEDVVEVLGDVSGYIAKEMTKKFEKHYRGKVTDLIQMLKRDGVRGEYTIVLDTRKK